MITPEFTRVRCGRDAPIVI